MKQIVAAILLSLAAISVYAQPRKFKLKPLTGYYLDDRIDLKDGLNFMVISNRRDFIKHFGLMNRPDTPNFDYHHVIVIALPPTKEQYFLSYEPEAAKAGDFIEVYCNIKHEKHKITYCDHPIVTAIIPRYFSVRKVNFYDKATKKLLESVEIRR